MNREKSRIILLVIATTTPLLLGACSESEQRDYVLPGEICDVQITPEKLLPLLPPGNEFEAVSEVDDSQGQTHERCSLMVDSSEKLSTELHFFTGRFDHPAQMLSNAGLTPKEIRIHGDAAVSSKRLIAYLECNPPGVPPESGNIYLNIATYTDVVEDDAQRMDLLEDFARDYADEVWEQNDCQG